LRLIAPAGGDERLHQAAAKLNDPP
jgi:hypothetical protein